jgi:hypothetical protein
MIDDSRYREKQKVCPEPERTSPSLLTALQDGSIAAYATMDSSQEGTADATVSDILLARKLLIINRITQRSQRPVSLSRRKAKSSGGMNDA